MTDSGNESIEDMRNLSLNEERVYCGCDGPDSMYIKLISSDLHELIIKREHAFI